MDSQSPNHDNTLLLFPFSEFVFPSAVGKTVLPLLPSFLFAILLYILCTLQAMAGPTGADPGRDPNPKGG